jgi:hypothetical protein
MPEDHVREWIKRKLEEGIGEERLRKTLEKTDHDPELVDEIVSAESSGEGQDPFNGSEGGEEDDPFDSLSYVEEEEEEGDEEPNEESESFLSGIDLPNIGIGLPELQLPRYRQRYLVFFVVLVVVGGLGYAAYSMDLAEVTGPTCEGGGTGVKMYSVGVENGRTVAEVFTGEEVDATLEVYGNGDKLGENTETVSGRQTISADMIGDRAVFHEAGCEEPSVERSY